MFIFWFIIACLWCLLLLAVEIAFGIALFTGAPFAVSQKSRVKKIAELAASLKPVGGRAVDLGSGDGRLVIALARCGFDAEGLEINPLLAWWSRLRIKRLRLAGRALINRANFWKKDLSEADVVVVFGIFYMMEKLENKLRAELKPGSVVICNFAKFPAWPPYSCQDEVYVYTVKE